MTTAFRAIVAANRVPPSPPSIALRHAGATAARIRQHPVSIVSLPKNAAAAAIGYDFGSAVRYHNCGLRYGARIPVRLSCARTIYARAVEQIIRIRVWCNLIIKAAAHVRYIRRWRQEYLHVLYLSTYASLLAGGSISIPLVGAPKWGWVLVWTRLPI